MIRKFFPLDKNYLLEEAQMSLQHSLLIQLVDKVKLQYSLRHNPLMIEDAFFQKITKYQTDNVTPLQPFYFALAGIYRFKFGDNQLELLWNGESHFEKYKQDWVNTFDQWTDALCDREQFMQAVLDLTVFLPQNSNAQLAENRMNFVMLNFLDVKIHKNRGIVAMKVA